VNFRANSVIYFFSKKYSSLKKFRASEKMGGRIFAKKHQILHPSLSLTTFCGSGKLLRLRRAMN
jgi:VanZ family protein